MAATIEYSLDQLAGALDVAFAGNGETRISGLASLAAAGPEDLSFFHHTRYYGDLLNTQAAAVILHPDYADRCPVSVLISEDPYITYARASRLFERRHRASPGIHPTAVVDPSADVDETAAVGAHTVIGANAQIGPRVEISASCTIGDDSRVGADGTLHPNVTLYHGVRIGERAIIHSGTVIGSDGFGFAPTGESYEKISQLGGVEIGDDVEIGASSCIDRGALDDTVIGDGVKIDNQVQIAHNVIIGANTVLCGCSAVAGSSCIGKNCTIAGGVGIINHLKIADGVTVTAMSLVNQSIEKQGVYSSGTGLCDTLTWRKNALRFRQLDEMSKRLRRLEKALQTKKQG